MTTVLEIVTRAFREGNLIPIGSNPTVKEQTEGLDIVNSYVLSMFGQNVGDKLREWSIPPRQRTAGPTRTYPLLPAANVSLVPTFPNQIPGNSRIVWDGSEQHVYLEPEPQDGSIVAVSIGSAANAANVGNLTIDGNGRLIAGADTVVKAKSPFVSSRWFYRGDLAAWVEIKAMALGDDIYFPVEYDDLWVCAGLTRLAPRYGKQINPATASRGAEVLSMFQARYFQTQPTGSGGELMAPAFESFNSNRAWMR